MASCLWMRRAFVQWFSPTASLTRSLMASARVLYLESLELCFRSQSLRTYDMFGVGSKWIAMMSRHVMRKVHMHTCEGKKEKQQTRRRHAHIICLPLLRDPAPSYPPSPNIGRVFSPRQINSCGWLANAKRMSIGRPPIADLSAWE